MTDRIDLWPVAIIEDRYNGVYSGGAWLAIANAFRAMGDGRLNRAGYCVVDGPSGDDFDADEFWAAPPDWIAVGATPDEALAALHAKIPEPK